MLGQIANLDPATSVKNQQQQQQQCTPTWRTFFGPKRRGWLTLGSLIVALLTMAASLCAWRTGRGTDDRAFERNLSDYPHPRTEPYFYHMQLLSRFRAITRCGLILQATPLLHV